VARKNVDMVYILLDNSIYGLTKGQSSPTSPLPMKSKTAPYGYLEEPLNPLAMYLGYNVSFIARGFSGKPKQLKDLFIAAIRHPGFAIVHVMSPCVSMNQHVTFGSMKELYAELPEDYDPSNRALAFETALDQSKLWTGLFYRDERPTLDERLRELEARAGGRYRDLRELLTHFG
jgi:2-oxoglutarate ferredoxin oxidoreductase subunit beta